jgi:Uncharacterized conserved protein
VAWMEREIDRMTAELEPLRNFLLPGGSPAAAHIHVARAVCRRAERRVVALSECEAVSPAAPIYPQPALGFSLHPGALRKPPPRNGGAEVGQRIAPRTAHRAVRARISSAARRPVSIAPCTVPLCPAVSVASPAKNTLLSSGAARTTRSRSVVWMVG